MYDTVAKMLARNIAKASIIAFLMSNYSIAAEKATTIVNNVANKNVTQQKVVEDIASMIKRHEGFRARAYNDSLGKRTIGYGFYLGEVSSKAKIERLGLNYKDVYSGKQQITEAQANILFQESLNEAKRIASSFSSNFNSLPKEIQNVLIDMSYNLGNRINKFQKMKAAVEARDWKTMEKEMINSPWYTQVGNRSKELVGIVQGVGQIR